LHVFRGLTQEGWYPPDPRSQSARSHRQHREHADRVLQQERRPRVPAISQRRRRPWLLRDGRRPLVHLRPKCLYDQYSGRFVVVALERYNPPNEGGSTSRSPTTRIRMGRGTSTGPRRHDDRRRRVLARLSGLGVDAAGIYVTSNLFSFDQWSFVGQVPHLRQGPAPDRRPGAVPGSRQEQHGVRPGRPLLRRISCPLLREPLVILCAHPGDPGPLGTPRSPASMFSSGLLPSALGAEPRWFRHRRARWPPHQRLLARRPPVHRARSGHRRSADCRPLVRDRDARLAGER